MKTNSCVKGENNLGILMQEYVSVSHDSVRMFVCMHTSLTIYYIGGFFPHMKI
jgi:hypothetical protein